MKDLWAVGSMFSRERNAAGPNCKKAEEIEPISIQVYRDRKHLTTV